MDWNVVFFVNSFLQKLQKKAAVKTAAFEKA